MMKIHCILLWGIVIAFCACKKASENSTLNNSNIAGEFSARIDGIKWNADSIKNAVIMNGSITILGTSVDSKTISITLADAGAVKYELNKQSSNNAVYFNDSTYVQFFTTAPVYNLLKSGEVDITEIDQTNHTITGSFHFDVYNDSCTCQRSITEGVFNKLPYITSLPIAKITDSFYAKIDDVMWTAQSISVNIFTGRFVVKGSEPDDSKFIELWMNRYLAPMSLDSFFHFIPPTPPFELHFDGFFNRGRYRENLTTELEDRGNGNVTIVEFDTSKKRFSGTFNFDAYSSMSGRTVKIMEGYFSVGY